MGARVSIPLRKFLRDPLRALFDRRRHGFHPSKEVFEVERQDAEAAAAKCFHPSKEVFEAWKAWEEGVMYS